MKFSILLLSMFLPNLFFSQIESGKKKIKHAKKEVKPSTDSLAPSVNLIYFSYGAGNSYRQLKPNGTFYGEPLGERANEFSLPVQNFNAGIKTELQKHLLLDLSIGVVNFGEAYDETINDTTTKYENTYGHICTPIKIQFSAGKKFQFFIGTGLQAQMLYKYKHDETISYAKTSSNTVDKSTKNMNFFTLSSCSDVGIQYCFNGPLRIFLSGDFYYQLNSTFLKQEAYLHRPFQYCGKLGIGLAF